MARYHLKIEARRGNSIKPFLVIEKSFEAHTDDGAISFACREWEYEQKRIVILNDPRYPTETDSVLLKEIPFP